MTVTKFHRRTGSLAAVPVILMLVMAACGSDSNSDADSATTSAVSTSAASTSAPETTAVDTTVAGTTAPPTTAKPKPKPGVTTTSTTATTPAITLNIPIVTVQLKPTITLLTGPPAQTCAQLAGANGKVKIYFDSKLASIVELKTSFENQTVGTGGWTYFTPPTCKSFAVTATPKSGSLVGSSKTIVVTLLP